MLEDPSEAPVSPVEPLEGVGKGQDTRRVDLDAWCKACDALLLYVDPEHACRPKKGRYEQE